MAIPMEGWAVHMQGFGDQPNHRLHPAPTPLNAWARDVVPLDW